MNSRKITDADIENMTVSALPTRPTAPSEFGGKGYTATEVKEWFDKLPLYIVERFNLLIDDICGVDGASIADDMKTGISSSHTLGDLFNDIKDGEICSYFMTAAGITLGEYLAKLRADINKIASRLSLTL